MRSSQRSACVLLRHCVTASLTHECHNSQYSIKSSLYGYPFSLVFQQVMGDRQLPAEYWELLQEGRVDEFYHHAVGFVLTREQYDRLN